MSLEEKFFSRYDPLIQFVALCLLSNVFRLLHDQIVSANDLEESVCVWDGEMWEDVQSFLAGNKEEESEDGMLREMSDIKTYPLT